MRIIVIGSSGDLGEALMVSLQDSIHEATSNLALRSAMPFFRQGLSQSIDFTNLP